MTDESNRISSSPIAGGGRSPINGEVERPSVFLLERDQAHAGEIARQLIEFGYNASVFSDGESLWSAARSAPPDAMLVDLDSLCEPQFRRAPVWHPADSGRQPPIVVLSARDDWDSRVNAVRCGGSAFIARPVDFTVLIEELDGLISDDDRDRYRVMIVDPSPLRSRNLSEALKGAGMEARVMENPSLLMSGLADFVPDLILMATMLPGCTAVEASAVIRQHPVCINIPIVYLSTDSDTPDLRDAIRLAGDELFEGPIGVSRLLSTIEIRARRFRKLKTLIGRDDLTGLLNHTSFKLALEREVARSTRRGHSLSVAILDLDHFKSINDRFGHPVGDLVIKSVARLLSHRLRKGDVVARYGGEEFAVMLPDTPPGAAASLLDELRQRFSEITIVRDSLSFNVTFSVGVAAMPPHNGVEQLITAADDAMYKAKRAGRNQVALDDAVTRPGDSGSPE